jgi:hypothetical protein
MQQTRPDTWNLDEAVVVFVCICLYLVVFISENVNLNCAKPSGGGLMEAYQSRAQAARREWEERTGLSAVTGVELRFQ